MRENVYDISGLNPLQRWSLTELHSENYGERWYQDYINCCYLFRDFFDVGVAAGDPETILKNMPDYLSIS